MGLFEKARERLILVPLRDYLVEKAKQDVGGSPGDMAGAVLRQNNPYPIIGQNAQRPGSNVSFDALRRFSVQYDVARACINRRKRQVSQLDWKIVAAEDDDQKDYSSIIRPLNMQFKGIGGYRVRFREFTDTIIEDLLTLDAVSLYKRPNRAGGLYALQTIDAATITLVVDEAGGTPMPPEIAYKQKIRGEVVAEFTADEMYYEMMNPRTSTPYGLSPLESLVLGVSSALKSELYNLHLLTEGNIPEGFFGVPETWKPADIKEFQATFDAAMAGDTRMLSKIKFMPDGKYTPTKKADDMRYKELQEWLMQKTCMLFEIQPEELGFTKTVNKATSEVQQDTGMRTGLKPLANFLEEIFTDVIQQDLGYTQLKFEYQGLDFEDEKRNAEINEIYIRSGQRTVDELRTDRGMKPLGVDKPFVIGTPTFIDPESMEAKAANAEAMANLAEQGTDDSETDDNKTDDENADGDKGQQDQDGQPNENKSYNAEQSHIQLVSELRTFRKYAIQRKKLGKTIRPFTSDVLPDNVTREINARLTKATDVEKVKGIFSEYMQDYQVQFLADVIDVRRGLGKVLAHGQDQ